MKRAKKRFEELWEHVELPDSYITGMVKRWWMSGYEQGRKDESNGKDS